METPFTARNVTKFVVTSTIKIKTAQVAEQAITDHTRFEEDDIVTNLGSSVVGWFIGDKLKPVTDKMVDKTADKVSELRAKRAAKKSAE